MKFTKHKLTDPMLRRLSQIKNGHDHLHGNSLTALVDRGLVDEIQKTSGEENTHKYVCGYRYEINDKGREALQQARNEGW